MFKFLNFVSPANLKKYGLYAILSFFICLCVFIGTDDLKYRNQDIQQERIENTKLQKMLYDQNQLKNEQEQLLKKVDTTKHK